MKMVLTTLLLILAGLPALATEHGAYVWGGYLNNNHSPTGLNDSVNHLLDHGGHVARIAISPQVSQDLGICQAPGTQTDACALGAILSLGAFKDPRLTTLIISFHDYLSNNFITTAGWTVANARAMGAEYAQDFAQVNSLLASRTTPLRIILGNWEGDNQIYCGQAYGFFANYPGVRAACPDWKNRTLGWFQWAQFRSDLVAGAPSTPQVLWDFMAEFNAYRMALPANAPGCSIGSSTCDTNYTIWNQIRLGASNVLGRATTFQHCSFSSYDSVYAKATAVDFPNILAACPSLIIGELGEPSRVAGWQTFYASAAATIANYPTAIPYTVIWNYITDSSNGDQGFGLYWGDATAPETGAGNPNEVAGITAAGLWP